MLAVEDGKRVPVEQGKIVPRYLLTEWFSRYILAYSLPNMPKKHVVTAGKLKQRR